MIDEQHNERIQRPHGEQQKGRPPMARDEVRALTKDDIDKLRDPCMARASIAMPLFLATIDAANARVEAMEKALAEAQQADMWWDPNCSEDTTTPEDCADHCAPGDTFRLEAAKRLPDQVFVALDDKGCADFREATPEEAQAHREREKVSRERHRREAATLPQALHPPADSKGGA